MISLRVNEIFNYLSSDRKEKCKVIATSGNGNTRPVDSVAVSRSSLHGLVLRDCDSSALVVPTVSGDAQDVDTSFCSESILNHTDEVSSVNSRSFASAIGNFRTLSKVSDADAEHQQQRQPRNETSKNDLECSKVSTSTEKFDFSKVATERSNLVWRDSRSVRSSAVENYGHAETEFALPKSQKKRNRRNRDRMASSTAQDFRTTSCLAVCTGDASVGGDRSSVCAAKSFHNTAEHTVTCVRQPGSDDGQYRDLEMRCCEVSAGDEARSSEARWSHKTPKSSSNVAQLDLEFSVSSTGDRKVCNAAVNSTILDALDSFDDVLPTVVRSVVTSECTTCEPDPQHEPGVEGEEWTSVNRRCKKVVLPTRSSTRRRHQVAAGTDIDIERSDDKLASVQIGSVDVSTRISSTLANIDDIELPKKQPINNRNNFSGRSRCVAPAAASTNSTPDIRRVHDSSCLPPRLSKKQTVTSPVQQKPDPLPVPVFTAEPSEDCRVKEYSLFDNHFSRTVERVLKTDICSQVGRNGCVGTSSAALLAKAPGYRASTASPCSGGRLQVDRRRKYSNDSSSSLSSTRSSDDSPPGGVLGSLGLATSSSLQPFTFNNSESTLNLCTLFTAKSEPAAVRSLADAAAVPTLADPVLSAVDVSGKSTEPKTNCQPHVEHYSSPNQPMTLPRIATDLNPYAPDFVFRPPGHSPSNDDVVPCTASAASSTLSSCDYMPLLSADEVVSAGGLTMCPGDGTLLFDVLMPLVPDSDRHHPQWSAASNSLIQESLTLR